MWRALTVAVLASTAVVVAGPVPGAAALSFTFTVDSAGGWGAIGVDVINNGASVAGGYMIKPCSLDPQEAVLGWDGGGNLTGTRSLNVAATELRFELYPGPCGTYSPWNNVGGIHIEASTRVTNLGRVKTAVLGRDGAFRIDGPIISSTPITEGRVHVDAFQIGTGYPDPPAPLQSNGIVEWGAFASGPSRGTEWTAGVGWSGRYIMFIKDEATNRKIQTLVDIAPGSIPTVDLDAICFGFDTCKYDTGLPGTAAGSFHPTSPTRILDTRVGLGIGSAMSIGDGRSGSPNPITRRAETDNHDLQVTGRFGIPTAGVSAVLLNVTAVDAIAAGYVSVVPKPQRVNDVFNDQGTYWSTPSTSNINVDNHTAVPNLVLARVGAGGKIRIVNGTWGTMHVVADVAGWFGTGGAYTNGAGFQGVVPDRAMDSRTGIGGPASRFAVGESRSVQIAGSFGIPSTAQSVVVNITSSASDGVGYLTAYPDGESAPLASNVNSVGRGTARANLAVVKVGAGGRIRVLASEAATDVIIDVLGSFGPYGGNVTTITPERLVDTRSNFGASGPIGPGQTRTFQVTGRGSVPGNATAVLANVTSTQSTSDSYVTVWPTGSAQPATSTVNFEGGRTTPNMMIVKLGAGGQLTAFNERGNTQLIVDILGYVT
ncbi:MAG: hypothetical protein ACOYL9_03555 [Ilumatobacteraceae bacterium]